MLSENNFEFTLSTPSPLPAYLNVHYICETASRLLFLSMHWARAVGAFQLLKLVLNVCVCLFVCVCVCVCVIITQ